MNTYSLFSHDQDMTIQFFDKFDKQMIKEAIIKHLKKDSLDTLELCKEYNKSDVKRFYGNEILNFYAVNPKNNKVSLVITKYSKECFKSIED